MSYYTQKEPPVRDHRLQLADSFSGHACELLDCQKEGCLMQKSRSFWQATGCQMCLTMLMACSVQNSAVVLHGPGGCGAAFDNILAFAKKGLAHRGLSTSSSNWITTELNEADVISGGESKLRSAIEYADREFRPEIIFVVVTCVPNIIGDDAAEVIEQAKGSVAAKLVGLHCAGFKTRVVASAYDAFYHGLLKAVSFEPEPWLDYLPLDPSDPRYPIEVAKEKYKISRTVNLWNAASIGVQDEKEITRLLNALGLSVQIYTGYSNLDKFRKISQAALNISLCDAHDDYMLKFLHEKYGMPYYIAGMPIGFSETRTWLLGVAKHFGLEDEAGRLADYEEALAKEAIKPFIPKIKGKRVLIIGGVVRVAIQAIALTEVGMDVIGAKLYHYDENAETVFENVAEKLPTLDIAVSNQLFEQAHQIKTLKPDLVISHMGSGAPAAKLGVPVVQLFSLDGVYFGYTGFYHFLRRIEFAFSNTNYQERLAKNIKQPYKDWYWEAETFSFIKG